MISTKAHTEPKKLELKMDNINIEYVNFFNFLVLTIDWHLTWENHTINMSNKFMLKNYWNIKYNKIFCSVKCPAYAIYRLNPAPSKLLCNRLGISM